MSIENNELIYHLVIYHNKGYLPQQNETEIMGAQ